MSFPHIDEHRLNTFIGIVFGELIKGWARQSAVWSGERSKFNDGNTLVSEVTQPSRGEVVEFDELRVGSTITNLEVARKAAEGLYIILWREVCVIVGT